MSINCYAFRSGNECGILNNNINCGTHCSFRKTSEECAASRAKAYDMLANLPNDKQMYIAGKYYQDKRPWLKKHVTQY